MRRRRHTHRRGRTRPRRLQLLDRLMEDGLLSLPIVSSPLAVDLGFGDEPLTTIEWQAALRKRMSKLRMVGVEREISRVEAAKARENEGLHFTPGGFDLRQSGIDRVSVVRCMNVLRGYGPATWALAQRQMLSSLLPGGLLIEGSSDTEGHLLTAHLWRRSLLNDEIEYEGLLLASDFMRGFAPRMFGDGLPRDLRRHVKEGEPIFEWLSEFQRAFEEVRSPLSKTLDVSHDAKREFNKKVFGDTVRLLAKRRSDSFAQGQWIQRGCLKWCPNQPSDRPEVLSPGVLPP